MSTLRAALRDQDPRVRSVFEVLGAFFTDILFNHVYANAHARLSGKGSLTDEYVRQAQAVMQGLKVDEKIYLRTVQNLHQYLAAQTQFTTISFSGFVDLVVGTHVPPEYFRDMASREKDLLLQRVICELVAGLVAFVTHPDVLCRVIDDHTKSPGMTTRLIQDKAVSIQAATRLELANKFTARKGQARETVDVRALDDYRAALQKISLRFAETRVARDEALARAQAAEEGLVAARRECASLRRFIRLKLAGDRDPAAAGRALLVPPERDYGHRRSSRKQPKSESEESEDSEDSEESEESEEESEEESDEATEEESEESERPRGRGKKKAKPRGKHARARARPAPFVPTAAAGGRARPAEGLADFFVTEEEADAAEAEAAGGAPRPAGAAARPAGAAAAEGPAPPGPVARPRPPAGRRPALEESDFFGGGFDETLM
jgi:hypothetical protein